MTTSLFEGRLLHVDAARQYTRHEGAYEGAALGHAVNIVWTSALAGVLAALFTSAQTRGVWTSLVAFVKRQRRGHGGPAIGRDAWLAARLPTVWSSRVRTSTPHLLIVPGLLLLMSSEVLPGSRAGWILAPVVVAAIFAACRNQEVARYRPSRSRIDITVLMIHFSVLCAAATVVYWLMQSTQRDAAAQFMVTLWGITVWCAFLQGTRSTSTLTAFGGIAIVGITAAGVAFAMWLVGTQIGSWLMTLVPVGRVGVVEGLIMFTGAVATVLLLMALLAFARRIEARSSLQRVVVASLITSSPIPAVLATIAFVMPQPKDITVARAGLSLLLALASTAVCLMMTDTTRRRLAGSTR